MATAADIIAIAMSQIGIQEDPPGSNYTKYHKAMGLGRGQPWCCCFIWWVFQTAHAGKFFCNNASSVAGCDTVYNYYRNIPQQIVYHRPRSGQGSGSLSNMQPGDIVLFRFSNPTDRYTNHIGIYTGSKNGVPYFVEGNTDTAENGRHTVYVCNKARRTSWQSIVFVYRPFSEASKPSEHTVKSTELSYVWRFSSATGELEPSDWDFKDEDNQDVITTTGDSETSASVTIKGLNPWYGLITKDSMLTQTQYLSMAAAINTFYDCCEKGLNDLIQKIPDQAINIKKPTFNKPPYVSVLNERIKKNLDGSDMIVDGKPVYEKILIDCNHITAKSFNIFLDAIYKYLDNQEQLDMIKIIQKYTRTPLTSLKVIEDDTIISVEIFQKLGEAVSKMSQTFTISWEIPEEEEEEEETK